MPDSPGMSRTDAERMVRVEESLKRVEGKLDLFVERAIEDRTSFTGRISTLEKFKYVASTAMLLSGAVGLERVSSVLL